MLLLSFLRRLFFCSALLFTEIGYYYYFSYRPDYRPSPIGSPDYDFRDADFTIFVGGPATGIAAKGPSCMYFHILPMLGSAQESSGVAFFFRHGHYDIKSGHTVAMCHPSVSAIGQGAYAGQSVLKTERVFIPKMAEFRKYYIRVRQEILVDAHFNPFSGSDEYNENGNVDDFESNSNYVFIPAKITLYDQNGTALYHYKNKDIAKGVDMPGRIDSYYSKWVAGADPGGDCFLEYYDSEDPAKNIGVGGWKANRHCFGRSENPHLYNNFSKMDAGEYLPYPPEAGYLEIEIISGIDGFKRKAIGTYDSSQCSWVSANIYAKLRWMLYKAPMVDVVNNNLLFESSELDDVEYRGTINPDAKDDITIDTIYGTSDKPCPTAKGAMFRTSTGEQVTTLCRALVEDHPEKLLIGTICSQYDSRRTVLSGEAVIDDGLSKYTESNQEDGKVFCLTSDVQDIIKGTTEAEYTEFTGDEYESEN